MSALSTALCKLCCPAWWEHLAWCIVLAQCWFCAKMYAFKLSPWYLLLPPCRFAPWLVHTQNAKRHYVCPHALGFYHRVSSSCCTRTSIRSTALMVPAVWVHACCWGRMEEIQGYLLTTTISSLLVDFKDACGGVRSWVGFNLSHLLPRDCTPPWKTPPLSLCLSGSGTVMLILGLKLPSKLKGLHYWPRCISTKYSPPLPVYLNFPDYVMNTQMTEWPRWCLPSHHGEDNLGLFMSKQKFSSNLHLNNIFPLLNKLTASIGLMVYITYIVFWQACGCLVWRGFTWSNWCCYGIANIDLVFLKI